MSYKEMAENFVKQFMIDNNIPEQSAKVPDQDSWIFSFRNIRFQVRINPYKQVGKQGHAIAVAALIIDVPTDETKRLALFDKLLNENNVMVNAAYVKTTNNQILLMSSRDVDGLDYSEFNNMILFVSNIGDSMAPELKAEFS